MRQIPRENCARTCASARWSNNGLFRPTFSFPGKKSEDSDPDLPDLVDSDSDTETTVPMDDDFVSIEDDDPTYCDICEMWIDSDPEHEHVFKVPQERCGNI